MEKKHTADYQLILTARKKIQICNWFMIMVPWSNNLNLLIVHNSKKTKIVSLDIKSVYAVRKNFLTNIDIIYRLQLLYELMHLILYSQVVSMHPRCVLTIYTDHKFAGCITIAFITHNITYFLMSMIFCTAFH